MQKIEKLEQMSILNEDEVLKINELIEAINKQQQEIEQLRQQISKVDNRTFQFQRVGALNK